ncbi:MAG: hydroxyacid dehydrogenase [Opitutales bacterium]
MAEKTPAAILLNPFQRARIYGQTELEAIYERCNVLVEAAPEEVHAPKWADALRRVEVVWSGWGGLKLTSEVLERLPALRLYLYSAGTVKSHVTEATWERGVRVCGAWAANAVPVAEFAFAQVILCLKHAWQFAAAYTQARRGIALESPGHLGAFGTTVGLISLGQIGQRLAERLKSLDVEVIAYDPYVSREAMAALGLRKVESMLEIFQRSEVVSLHTPWLPETEGLLRREHFQAMKPGAAFINTARGAVVDEPALIEVLQARPDLFACLDVTWPEPPAPDSPLWALPNIFLTPHLAGAQAGECRRMCRYMIEEFDRWRAGETLQHEITRERLPLLG